jgi:Na+/melibiose symporter-like transporter
MRVGDLHTQAADVVRDPKRLGEKAASLSNEIVLLKQQPPQALFRLRVIEIGLPLALSVVSLLLTLRYPLTEARSYEIKEALQKRHADMGV